MTDLINDPNQIAKLAAAFESNESDVVITTTSPPFDEVVLPGGFLTEDGSLIKLVQIRELNGSDEEAIAKSSTPGKALEVVLSRGLVSLDGETVNKSQLDQLLAGDREAILIGIRVATFGETVMYNATCFECSTTQELEVNLTTDLNTVALDDPINDRVFSVKGKAGDIVLSLPNGVTTKRLVEIENQPYPELVTALLSGCIISVNDEPSIGKSTALNLGMSDRELLVKEIYARNPGPRLGEVNKACEACGKNITLLLSLADLFRL
jgi:hypothetical protein